MKIASIKNLQKVFFAEKESWTKEIASSGSLAENNIQDDNFLFLTSSILPNFNDADSFSGCKR